MSRRLWLTPEERKARKKAQKAEYWARPEVKAHKKAQQAEYYARPEVKARRLARAAEYLTRPEIKARNKARRAEYWARPEVKANYRAVKYSLTIEAIQALLAAGCVAATIANASRCAGSLEIDHDHRCCDRDGSCGKCVRGALCLKHNKVLGGYEASVSWAPKYLASYQAKQEGGRS